MRGVMFLRHTKRKKDGKEHRYWSIVENRRVGGDRGAAAAAVPGRDQRFAGTYPSAGGRLFGIGGMIEVGAFDFGVVM